MKESLWGYLIMTVGFVSIMFVFFFQSYTNLDEQNYYLLKEITEAAMIDAVDMATFRATGEYKIDEKKFVENFVRRFSESVNLSNEYEIKIYDVNESPPKVSLEVISTKQSNITGALLNFDSSNKISAILETPY